MSDILIIDDDDELRGLLADFTEVEGYSVRTAASAEEGIAILEREPVGILLLDLMLPGIDGYQVCREVRKEELQVPIIMLSAKGEVFDKVLGLELGADDYMEKPFDSKELVARVKAVLRRYKPVVAEAPQPEPENEVRLTDLTINRSNYSVTFKGRRVEMPPKELELLYFLASQPNHVYSREQLLDQIWGYEYVGDTRTVDVHIKRIREKIGDHDHWKITTIWGVGYKFELM